MPNLIAGNAGPIVGLMSQAGYGRGQQQGWENQLRAYQIEEQLELARKQNSFGNMLFKSMGTGLGGALGMGLGAGAGAGIAGLFGLGGAGSAAAAAPVGWAGAGVPSYAMTPLGLVSSTPNPMTLGGAGGTLPTGGSTILEGHLPMTTNPFAFMM